MTNKRRKRCCLLRWVPVSKEKCRSISLVHLKEFFLKSATITLSHAYFCSIFRLSARKAASASVTTTDIPAGAFSYRSVIKNQVVAIRNNSFVGSVLFYSVPFCSVQFCSVLLGSVLFRSVPLRSVLFYSILSYPIPSSSVLFPCASSVHYWDNLLCVYKNTWLGADTTPACFADVNRSRR